MAKNGSGKGDGKNLKDTAHEELGKGISHVPSSPAHDAGHESAHAKAEHAAAAAKKKLPVDVASIDSDSVFSDGEAFDVAAATQQAAPQSGKSAGSGAHQGGAVHPAGTGAGAAGAAGSSAGGAAAGSTGGAAAGSAGGAAAGSAGGAAGGAAAGAAGGAAAGGVGGAAAGATAAGLGWTALEIGGAAAVVGGGVATAYTSSNSDNGNKSGSNHAPEVPPQTAAATEDSTLSGQLRATDNDSGSVVTFAVANPPAGFTLTNPATGAFTFDAGNAAYQSLAAHQALTLVVDFIATDEQGATTASTLTITVTGTNDAPVASATTSAVNEDSVVSGQLLATDIDQNATRVFATTGAAPVAGFTLTPNGAWSFDAGNAAYQSLAAGQTQVVTIPFTVSDNQGGVATSTLTITVTGTNDAPIAQAVVNAANEDTTITGALVATDVDSTSLTYSVAAPPAGFALTNAATGAYSFDAGNAAYQSLLEGEKLVLSIPYSVSDGQGGTASATLTITVTGTNDLPVASAVTGAGNEDAALSGTLAGAVTDADSGQASSLTFSTSNAPAGFTLNPDGTWTLDATNAAYQDLAAGATRTLTINYVATDHNGGQAANTLTITVTGVNDVPVIKGATLGDLSATEESDLRAGGELSITDADGNQSKFAAASANTTLGSYTLSVDGVWTYTLNNANATVQALAAGATTTDSFTAVSSDGTATKVVTITITGTNDVPTIGGAATGDRAVTEDSDSSASGTLTIADTDSGQSTFAAATGSTSFGTYTLASGGAWTYTLNNANASVQALAAGATMTDTFTAVSSDGSASQVVTITITGANDVPVITGATSGDRAVTEDLDFNATGQLTIADADGGQSAFTAASGTTSLGSAFTVTAGGVWTYALNSGNASVQALAAGATMSDTFTVTSSDGTASQVVTITITGTNDVPAIGGTSAGSVTEESGLTATGTLTSTDTDTGQSNAFTAAGTPTAVNTTYGSFSVTSGGAWTYNLNNANASVQALGAGQTLTDSFTVTSGDGSATKVVTITINGTNDVPTIGGAATGDRAVTEDSDPSASGRLTIADTDSGQGTFAPAAGSASFGTFTVGADGLWTYTLDNTNGTIQALAAGATATDTFTATSSDGTASQVVTITITGTNDVPSIGGTSAGSVTEDGSVSSTGTLTSTDTDTGQSNTFTAVGTPTSTSFGSFTVTSGGLWTYTLNNANASVQALGAGQTLTDSFSVTSGDGSATKVVTITINGTNDGPVLGGTNTGDVTEDTAQFASGVLTISDVDQGQAAYVATNGAGSNGYGSFAIESNGHWTYSLNTGDPAVQALSAGATLTDTFTATSADGTASQVVTITITGTNDAPVVAIDDLAGAVTELGAAGGNITDTGTIAFSDVDSSDSFNLSSVTASAGALGTLTPTLGAGGINWTYSVDSADVEYLAEGVTKLETFTFTLDDGNGGTVDRTVAVTITGTNDAPVANGTSGSIDEGTGTLTGQLDASDVDATDGRTFSLNGAPPAGFNLNADGFWTFDANNAAYDSLFAGQTEVLSIDFTVTDIHGATATNTLTITVTGTNDGPVAVADTAMATENGVTSISVLDNDGDVDGDTITVTSASLANSSGSGSVDFSSSAVFFNPGSDFDYLAVGETTNVVINYTIEDSSGAASTSSVTLTVVGANDAPDAYGTTGSIDEGTGTLTGQLNAFDVDATDGRTFSLNGAPPAGFNLNADGFWTFDANSAAYDSLFAGQTEVLSIDFTVTDIHGATATNTLTITVKGTNDGPVAVADTATTLENSSVSVAVLDNDSDVDGDSITVTSASLANSTGSGSVTFSSSNVFFNPGSDFDYLAVGETANVVVTYTIEDSNGSPSTSSVTITVAGENDAPVASSGSYGATEDGSTLTGQLTATDVDATDGRTFSLTGEPPAGFTLSADGTWTFNPGNGAYDSLAAGATLPIDIVFMVTDIHGATDTGTLSITVTGANDGPVASALSNVATEGGSTITGNLVATDVDNASLTYAVGSPPAGFSLTNPATGAYSFDPTHAVYNHLAAGDTQVIVVSYTATDAGSLSSTGTLTITVTGTNDAPVASAATGSGNEDALITGTITATDADDHTTLVYSLLNGTSVPAGFTLNPNGTWSLDAGNAAYQHIEAGQSATATVTYVVLDSDGGTASNTLTITINGANDAANITGTAAGSVTEDASLTATGTLVANDVDDTENAFVTVTAGTPTTGGHGTFGVTSGGAWTFSLANSDSAVQALGAGETMTDTFAVTSKDGSDTQVVTITITGTNDGAVISQGSGDDYDVTEGSDSSASGTLGITDVDTGEAHFVAVASGATEYGGYTLASNGAWTYTLNSSNANVNALASGDSMSDTFTAVAADGTTQAVTITIHGGNDAPVAVADTASVSEDSSSSASGNLLANDTDADNHPTIRVSDIGGNSIGVGSSNSASGSFGSVAVSDDGSYLYFLYSSSSAVQALAEGETLVDTFTYTVTDEHGASDTATLAITIVGTNDDVVEDNANTTNLTGTFYESDLGLPTDPVPPSVAAGTIAFTDLDANDTHVVSARPDPSNTTAYGTFILGGTNEAIGAQNGSVGWSYVFDNSLGQSLPQGTEFIEKYIVTVEDGHGSSFTETVTIHLFGTNDDPVAFADPNDAQESGVLVGGNSADSGYGASGNLLSNDTDVDVPHHLHVSDIGGTGLSSSGSSSATVAGTFGSINVQLNGDYIYTVDNAHNSAADQLSFGEVGTDTFTYTVMDEYGGTDTATVTITIHGTNDTPDAVADSNSLDPVVEAGVANGGNVPAAGDATATGNLLSNDTDVDHNHVLHVSDVGGSSVSSGSPAVVTGTYGSVTVGSNGAYTYNLANGNAATQALSFGETATDTFSYTVMDEHGATSTAVLTITVQGTNDAPVATGDSDSVTESGVSNGGNTPNVGAPTATGNVLSNDTDVDHNHSLSVVITDGNLSTASGASAGTIEGFLGLSSGELGSLTAHSPTNGAALRTSTVIVHAGDQLTVAYDFNDTDSFDDFAFVTLSGPVHSAVVVESTNAPQAGPQVYTYTFGSTGSFVIGVGVANNADTAVDGTLSVGSVKLNGTALSLTGIGNATQQLSFAGSYGSLVLNGNGGYTYNLDNSDADTQALAYGATGSDVFNYIVTDEHGATSSASLTITVNGTNDRVLIGSADSTGSVTEDAGSPDTATGTISFSDVDIGDTHTAVVVGGGSGAYGTLSLATGPSDQVTSDGTSGSVGWTYTIDNAAAQKLSEGETVTETYTIKVSDNNGAFASTDVMVTITGDNDDVVAGSAQNGGVTEDSVSLATATGTLTFTDVDLSDTHTATFSGSGSYGTFSLDTGSSDEVTVDTTGTGLGGQVGWTYNINNAAAQKLSQGEQYTETYTISVVDHYNSFSGSGDTQTVTVTITGTNDNVVVTSGAQTGSVAEDSASSASSTGTLTFTDADEHDTHTAIVVGGGSGAYGTLSLATGPSDQVTSDGTSGSVGWTYTINNAAAQKLSQGETATETYTISVVDHFSSYAGPGDTQTVTITVTGDNDNVVVTSGAQTGGVTEDSASFASATGTLTFTDVDLSDTHTATFSGSSAYGTFSLDTGSSEEVTVDTTGTGLGGQVAWTYAIDNAAAQKLSQGEQYTETYTISVVDHYNSFSGSSDTQTVAITITGTNDNVVVTSVPQTGGVAEDSASFASATGTLTFTDVDLSDSHTATFSGSGAYGTFSLDTGSSDEVTVDTTGTGLGGQVAWTYAIDNAAAQKLSEGETATETYTISVVDHFGSYAGPGETQQVTITITGDNDNVVVTSGAQTGGVTEDSASFASATGTLTFTDVDLSDTHTATFTGPGSYGTFSLDTGLSDEVTVDTTGTGSGGQVAWTYTIGAGAQKLSEGETATETYTISVVDHYNSFSGSGDTQTVTITITGDNDNVVVTSGAQTGGVTEDSASFASATGTLTFTDVDLSDTHTATFSGSSAYGSFSLATGSSDEVTVDTTGLGTGGQVAWTYNIDNVAAQSLGQGETATEVFTISVVDHYNSFSGSGDTQQVTITITGVNDSVAISSVTDGSGTDADTASLTEEAATFPGATLSTSGSLTVRDPDNSDTVDLSYDSAQTVGVAGTFSGTLPLSNADLVAFFGLTGTTDDIAANTPDSHNLGWDFDSSRGTGATGFDFLGENETLILSYVVTATDFDRNGDPTGTSDTHTVTITITGTNDVPTVTTAATGDATALTFTVADPDLTDTLTASLPAYVSGTVKNDALGDGATTLTLLAQGTITYDTLVVKDDATTPATVNVADLVLGTSSDDAVTPTATTGGLPLAIYTFDGDDTATFADATALNTLVAVSMGSDTTGDKLAFSGNGVTLADSDFTHVFGAEKVEFQGTGAQSLTLAANAVAAFSSINVRETNGGATSLTLDGASFTNVIDAVGTSGNDTLTGGSAADKLLGSAGTDTITGGDGADDLQGGDDNDVFLIASTGDYDAGESIDGGNDTGGAGDTIRFTSTTAGQTLTLTALVTTVETAVISNAAGATTGTTALNLDASAAASIVTITGNDGDNTLTGNASANTISGNGGADTITGGAGADAIDGGAGNDIILIDDVAEFAAGETINGGANTDEIRFTSTTAAQTLTLTAGVTNVETVRISSATAVTTGTTALNVDASAVANAIALVGNDGDNVLTGNGLANTITANGGNDTITGGGADDNMNGGNGNDLFLITAQTDHSINEFITGGAGTDRIYFTSTTANETLTLSTHVLGVEEIRIADSSGVTTGTTKLNIVASVVSATENIALTGNDGDNNLTGNDGNNVITGGGGNDNMQGLLGNDIFVIHSPTDYTSGVSSDTINGGGGTDVIYFTSTTDTDSLNLQASVTAVEEVRISDISGATTGTEKININASAMLSTENIAITGNDGINTLTGSDGNNVINGNGGADNINAGAGNDTVDGGSGDDALLGSAGTDSINGGSGADLISGGTGNDTLTGGTGNDIDTFQFESSAAANGNDTITDFQTDATTADDKLDLSAFTGTVAADHIVKIDNSAIPVLNSGEAYIVIFGDQTNDNSHAGVYYVADGGNAAFSTGSAAQMAAITFGSGADGFDDFTVAQNVITP